MKKFFRERRTHLRHAARVAAVATLLLAATYVALVIVFDVVDASHLVGAVDAHLADRLMDTVQQGTPTSAPGVDNDHDVDAAPVFMWKVTSQGQVSALSFGSPTLRSTDWVRSGQPTTAALGRSSFRFESQRVGSGWLVAGQSLAETIHVENVLLIGEVIAGPLLVLAMFIGALAIGLNAARPVEHARLRQLEFAADASHELRTPLSVIEAEVGLALTNKRSPESYRDTLGRIARESDRLRRIVEDLLWLARFDSEPSWPEDELVDVAAIAIGCADRFTAVARVRAIEISVRSNDADHAWINAPAEWIDRLAGVLVDNACRYAGADGIVHIVVAAETGRVRMSVEDNGPGIPPDRAPPAVRPLPPGHGRGNWGGTRAGNS